MSKHVVIVYRRNMDGVLKVIGPVSLELARVIKLGYEKDGVQATFTNLTPAVEE